MCYSEYCNNAGYCNTKRNGSFTKGCIGNKFLLYIFLQLENDSGDRGRPKDTGERILQTNKCQMFTLKLDLFTYICFIS